MSKNQDNAVITKTKAIRIKLEGDHFLDFHNMSGRIAFKGKMNEKAIDEALVKLGLSLLKKQIDARLQNGETFIQADSI
jgi:hypothetical protein